MSTGATRPQKNAPSGLDHRTGEPTPESIGESTPEPIGESTSGSMVEPMDDDEDSPLGLENHPWMKKFEDD